MELSTEFIETNKLAPEQVAAVKAYSESHVATLQKEWDTKANDNAENILGGVVKSIQKKTGIEEPRLQGEKYAAYLERVSSKVLETKQSELDTAKTEYESKLKDFKGGDALKVEVETAKKAYDTLLQKVADYDEVKKKAGEYEDLSGKYSQLKVGTAFRDVKPTFPADVNSFERDAKWKIFEESTLKEYDVEIVDGVAKAISKENKYNIVTLESLVKANAEIQGLLAERRQVGINGKQVNGKVVNIEGVPFAVPETCDSAERAKLIREHLTSKGLNTASEAYSKEFAELNKKILNRGK